MTSLFAYLQCTRNVGSAATFMVDGTCGLNFFHPKSHEFYKHSIIYLANGPYQSYQNFFMKQNDIIICLFALFRQGWQSTGQYAY